MASILFVVAHPDDVSNGMGGTAYSLKDEYELSVVCATKGERGLRGRALDETGAIREAEEQRACALLGARLEFLGQIDREVTADRPTCERVANIFRRLQPAAVFTLWPIDSHPDHSAVSEIAKKAVFLAESSTEMVYCEEAEHQTALFEPEIFVDISPVIEKKLELIRCHVCQNRDDAMAQAFLHKARVRGAEAGCEYAEAFRSLAPPERQILRRMKTSATGSLSSR